MTVDHETDKLYWAGYQGKTGRGYFFEVNKEDGSLLSMVKTADNAELSGLFKPYDCGRALLPENEAATALLLSKTELYLTMNQTAVLTCLPKPYYAGMENVTWTSDNPEVATVSDGIVKATRRGDCHGHCPGWRPDGFLPGAGQRRHRRGIPVQQQGKPVGPPGGGPASERPGAVRYGGDPAPSRLPLT